MYVYHYIQCDHLSDVQLERTVFHTRQYYTDL